MGVQHARTAQTVSPTNLVEAGAALIGSLLLDEALRLMHP